MLGIHKRFGEVRANQGVDLRVPAGSIHAVVGENGAGKSTLMSILYGFYAADKGEIRVHGRVTPIRSAQDALALGIGMVHQHFLLVDSLSVIENVMLGAESHALLYQAEKQARVQLEALMQSTGLRVSLDLLAGDLAVGDRQRLEILKALFRGARILILDEPTAVLTPQQTEQLFEVLERLRAAGTTILIITHKLREVMRLCDGVTVMRAGTVVLETTVAKTSIDQLAQAMVGRKLQIADGASRTSPAHEEILLQAEALSYSDSWGVRRLHAVNLTLCAGEIVGVAGVSGNGQSELLELLAGMKRPQIGQLHVGGHSFSPRLWLQPKQARSLGLSHVPEDRQARALVMNFSAWESALLGYEYLPEYSRGGWLHRRAIWSAAEHMMEDFDVRPRSPALRCSKFSGGNQQKLVLAREISQRPRILLVGQPTRGVDIGAIEFIHARLRALRDEGCAILLVSSELEEILLLADRVLVIDRGAVTGELPVTQCDEAKLGRLMAGEHLQ
jgi:simple sugar transport system ATP-binding protein